MDTENIFLVEIAKKHEEFFPTLLGHVGCYILIKSKIILLKRLLFLLKFLNPKLAQLLYLDTDKAHFSVKHINSSRKCKPPLETFFQRQFNKHFESGFKSVWPMGRRRFL